MFSNIPINLKPPIAVVCHDAGGGNQILNIISSVPNKYLRFSVSGPSELIFKRERKKFKNLDLNECLHYANTLISGTSTKNIFKEYNARQIANEKNIFNITILDHWFNYVERFLRNDVLILPNEIWTTDRYAFKFAKVYFKDLKIRLVKNVYLNNEIKKIQCLRNEKKNYNESRIVYLAEPFNNISHKNSINEFKVLDNLLKNFYKLKNKKNYKMLIFLHPSESKNKYDDWVEKNASFNIKIEKQKSLSEVLSWSNKVIGFHTYAMYIALKAKKTVYSCITNHEGNNVLPFKNIKYIHEKG